MYHSYAQQKWLLRGGDDSSFGYLNPRGRPDCGQLCGSAVDGPAGWHLWWRSKIIEMDSVSWAYDFFFSPIKRLQFATENGHRNSWLTHKRWWFSIVMLVYQRVNGCFHSTSSFSHLISGEIDAGRQPLFLLFPFKVTACIPFRFEKLAQLPNQLLGFYNPPRSYLCWSIFDGWFPSVDAYPLVNIYITTENRHFEWVNQL